MSLPKLDSDPSKIYTFGAFVFDNMDLLDLIGPLRIFGEPQTAVKSKIILIGKSLDKVTTGQQVEFTPHYTLETAPALDFFLIPGGAGTRKMVADTDTMAAIKARCEQARWCLTVCTGAGLLAATGLMDGRRMTTNKMAFEWPVSQGPRVNWVKRARWVQDGKYVSSSGVSAGIDMALFVVAELVGKENAELVAKYIEYTWHTDANQDPFADMYEYTRTE